MSRLPPLLILALAFLVVVGVALLPRPWKDLGGFLLMAGLFAFSLAQERATGKSAGLIKWLALALAVFNLWGLVSFFLRAQNPA